MEILLAGCYSCREPVFLRPGRLAGPLFPALSFIYSKFYAGCKPSHIKPDRSALPTKIILITFEEDENTYNKAKKLGIYGYVLKEFALEELENCITSVISGKAYFSPELIVYLKSNHPPEKLESLTEAESNILTLIAEAKTAKEIAKELNISSRTVEKHKSHIRTKLVLGSKSESLYLFAKENLQYL